MVISYDLAEAILFTENTVEPLVEMSEIASYCDFSDLIRNGKNERLSRGLARMRCRQRYRGRV
jgi:hypothetical protein